MKMSEIELVSFSRDGFLSYVKSPTIWGYIGTAAFPLCYLTKPKSLTAEEWAEFLDNFSYKITKQKPEATE
jgi:hypothetical protein